MSTLRPSAAPPAPCYYDNERPEVAAVVPFGARYVVDVGCGAGALGRYLKANRVGVEVRGIELVAEQAERARAVLDDVMHGPAEDPPPPSWPRPDCVVFADVLEHLVDPWAVLRSWRGRLAEGGVVIISLPNVAFRSAVFGLLRGHWRYEPEGVLDRTHLRFFTRDSAFELVEQAGLRVCSARRLVQVPWGGYAARAVDAVIQQYARREPERGAELSLLRFGADLCTMQFLIVAS